MKIADCLAFCGDRGLYFIGLMDIHMDYKKLFIQLVRSLNVFLQKSPKKIELTKANIDLVMNYHTSDVLPFYSTFYRYILPFITHEPNLPFDCFILPFTVLSYLLHIYRTLNQFNTTHL